MEQTGRGLGGLDEEVVRSLEYGAAPCEGADDAAGIEVGNEFARAGEQNLHIAGVRVLVSLLSHLGGGGDDRVVVHGSRYDDALGHRGRHRVERHDGAGLLVEYGDVALAPYHAQPAISGHARDLARAAAGGVDQDLASDVSLGRGEDESSLSRAVDGRYRSAAHEGGSVGYGVLGCGDGDFERIDIAG